MSAYKRGKIYHYDFWFNGQRYRDTTQQLTRKAAEEVESKVKRELREIAAGIRIPTKDDSPRFAEWADVYLTDVQKRLARPDAVESQLTVVMRFWGAKPKGLKKQAQPGEDAPYHDLRLLDPIVDPSWLLKFEKWMNARRWKGRPLSEWTKWHYITTVSEMYALARKPTYRALTHVPYNPFDDGIERKKKEPRDVTLDPDELRLVLGLAGYHLRLALAIAALAPKLRKTTILSLRWDRHVDLKRRLITVKRHKTAHLKHRPQVAHIVDQLMTILVDAKQRNLGPFVVSYRGHGIKDVRTGLAAALKRVGLRYGLRNGVTFHSMRHSMATLLAELDVSESKRQNAMGHASIQTTQQYTHLRPKHEVDALEQLSAAVPIADLVMMPWRRVPKALIERVGTSVGTHGSTSTNAPMNPGISEDSP